MAEGRQKRRRAKQDARREHSKKPPRRRLLSCLAALIGASGLLATVTGLVVARSFDPISDSAADVIGSSPLVAFDGPDDLDALTGAAFAFDHVLPPAALTG